MKDKLLEVLSALFSNCDNYLEGDCLFVKSHGVEWEVKEIPEALRRLMIGAGCYAPGEKEPLALLTPLERFSLVMEEMRQLAFSAEMHDKPEDPEELDQQMDHDLFQLFEEWLCDKQGRWERMESVLDHD